MRLIGLLDSPYVRRTAISLRFMQLPYSHEALSVFRHYDAFAAINPVVKAPTLVTDDGTVLLDSELILDHVERSVAPERRLMPSDVKDHARAQRIVGLALAACEKTVQIVYEYERRPEEKRHQPWIDRVRGQLDAAYRLIEQEIAPADGWLFGGRPLRPDITLAVARRFTHEHLPEVVRANAHPAIARLAERAEATPEFLACPFDG